MTKNILLNENCIDTLKNLPDNYIDMVLTSPPYDNMRQYNNTLSWNTAVWQKVLSLLYQKIKVHGVVVWIVSDATVKGSETGTSFKQALYAKEIGFNLHDTMIFQKTNYMPMNHMRYDQAFEYIFIFSKGKIKTFNPIKVKTATAGKNYNSLRARNKREFEKFRREKKYFTVKNDRIHNNIFSYSVGGKKTTHPATFPMKLVEEMIGTFSNEGDLIYDPFAGIGTTLIGAQLMGRQCIGSEIVKEYCKEYKRTNNFII